METKTQATRRSRCVHCGRSITEKPVIKAVDAQQFIAEYGTYEDDLVWVDGKAKRALCDTQGYGTAHITPQEWKSANAN